MGEEEAGDRYHDDDRDPWSSSLPVVVCKGKRSKRQRVHAAPPPPAEVVVVIVAAGAEAESSSADAGWRSGAEEEEEGMALCLMLLARGRGGPSFVAPDAAAAESTAKKEGKFRSRRPADGGGAGEFVYECRTCGRCFPSFQALGGHRTSHNKPRLLLLTAATSDEERRTPSLSPSRPSPAPHATADPTALAIPAVPATPPKHETSTDIDVSRRRQQPQQQGRVHECGICGAEFASGQALGGHMRRHRPLVVPASAASSSDDLAAIRIIKEKSLLELDLNMPAPCDEDAAETTSPVAPTHVGAGGGLPLLASKAKQSGRGQ